MTPTVDLVALSPFVALGATILIALLAITVHRHHALVASVTAAGLVLSLATLPWAATRAPVSITALLAIDGIVLFFLGLVLIATLVITALTYGYASSRTDRSEELYVLLLIGALGAGVLVASDHFASLFLGIETLSVALYGLIGYFRERPRSIEAAFKYLVLAGAASALLLFGMALVYAELGTMHIATVTARLLTSHPFGSPPLLAGMALVIAGFGFKLALVPFHRWTPEIYQAAPSPAAAFIATVSKGAVLAVLLRGFSDLAKTGHVAALTLVGVVAGASMIVGNLLALLEENLKRIIAYSSIAHVGYALVAFLAGGHLGATALGFYVAAYFLTVLVAFGVITVLEGSGGELGSVDDYRGLAWRRPYLAGALGLSLLSLAGIPLTAGFFGKLYVALAGISAALWAVLALLIAGSALGLFYYLRVIAKLVAPVSTPQPAANSERVPILSVATVGTLTAALVILGIYPVPMQEAIRLAFEAAAH